MKQPLNEEFRRMQKLAGLINKSQLSETKLFADFNEKELIYQLPLQKY